MPNLLTAKLEYLQPFIAEVGSQRRTCHWQIDGSLILADECTCHDGRLRWDCPVDVHAVTARMREIAAEEDATLRSSSSSSLLIQLGERKRKSLPAL